MMLNVLANSELKVKITNFMGRMFNSHKSYSNPEKKALLSLFCMHLKEKQCNECHAMYDLVALSLYY